jgi:uncharacterized protein (DUF2267 family)
MDYQTFTRVVARRAGLPRHAAERIEHATLRTLANRISGGEAQDLASQLPGPLQDALRPPREETVPAHLTTATSADASQRRPGPPLLVLDRARIATYG